MRYKAIIEQLNGKPYEDEAVARAPQGAIGKVIGYALSDGHEVTTARISVYRRIKRAWILEGHAEIGGDAK